MTVKLWKYFQINESSSILITLHFENFIIKQRFCFEKKYIFLLRIAMYKFEMLLKVALNTITLTLIYKLWCFLTCKNNIANKYVKLFILIDNIICRICFNHFWGLARTGIKPTIYRTQFEHAYNYTDKVVSCKDMPL